MLTSSQTNPQINHLLTSIPLTYNLCSSDTEKNKNFGGNKNSKFILGNIMRSSQAAALVPQLWLFSHPCTPARIYAWVTGAQAQGGKLKKSRLTYGMWGKKRLSTKERFKGDLY
jgi:hypothetical protein